MGAQRLFRDPATRLPVALFLAVLLLQLLVARFVHQGNPLGLFLVGDQISQESASWPIEVPVRKGSIGYDGQFFLILALDPTLSTSLSEGLDDVSYRAHRIAWSGAAFVLGGGSPASAVAMLFILQAGLLAAAATVIANSYSVRISASHTAFVLLFSLGSIACISRMVGDLVMVCLLVLALHFSRLKGARNGALAVAFMASCILQKETAVLALPAFALWDRSQRWFEGTVRLAVPLGLVALWWWYVGTQAPWTEAKFAGINLDIPFRGWIDAIWHTWTSDRSLLGKAKEIFLLVVFGALVWAGVWRGVKALFAWLLSRPVSVFDLALLGFSALAIFLSGAVWVELWAYSRALLPVVVLLLICESRMADGRTPVGKNVFNPVFTLLVLQSLAGLVFLLKNLLTGTP